MGLEGEVASGEKLSTKHHLCALDDVAHIFPMNEPLASLLAIDSIDTWRSAPPYASSLFSFTTPLVPVCLISTGPKVAGHSSEEVHRASAPALVRPDSLYQRFHAWDDHVDQNCLRLFNISQLRQLFPLRLDCYWQIVL